MKDEKQLECLNNIAMFAADVADGFAEIEKIRKLSLGEQWNISVTCDRMKELRGKIAEMKQQIEVDIARKKKARR